MIQTVIDSANRELQGQGQTKSVSWTCSFVLFYFCSCVVCFFFLSPQLPDEVHDKPELGVWRDV